MVIGRHRIQPHARQAGITGEPDKIAAMAKEELGLYVVRNTIARESIGSHHFMKFVPFLFSLAVYAGLRVRNMEQHPVATTAAEREHV